MKKRLIFPEIVKRLKERRQFIQVLIGPRQVGKTTLAHQAAKEVKKPCHYISADLVTLQDLAWLHEQWEMARVLARKNKGAILIIDEVQKIPHWSETIKALWDQDTREGTALNVVMLGSSPWLIQQGLKESLAGRFETIPITHWSFEEMQTHFKWSLDKYLYFGGYPGSAKLANTRDPLRWMNYINDSLIETTISRDILLMTVVNKPALLRRLFQLGCHYSGQILSYSKMQGQLQDAGNTTTLAHYLGLLAGAGLVAGLEKFSPQKIVQKGSSPKLLVFNTALMTAQVGKTYYEVKKDPEYLGRLTESVIGAHLLNKTRGTQIELFYWREGDHEVDFVLQHKNKIVALEVKSGQRRSSLPGMNLFLKRFKSARPLLVGVGGIPIESFLSSPLTDFI